MIHFPSNNWVLLCPIATNFVVVDVYLTFIKFVAFFGICWSARDYFMLLFLCSKLSISRYHGDLFLICPFLLNQTENMSAYPETPR